MEVTVPGDRDSHLNADEDEYGAHGPVGWRLCPKEPPDSPRGRYDVVIVDRRDTFGPISFGIRQFWLHRTAAPSRLETIQIERPVLHGPPWSTGSHPANIAPRV
ncbi:hypothetical protein GCM10009835_05170 [Planosporangium flavigriseum]|uniref:Uncharacterized protein n=1 Tax=Planosporangium flavigriseum TaxID=373681 RepID=A0A8J3PKA0_9ACTN|nr:hypothetical protein Pfl04_15450 [Planosporangium flavigriseum]